MNATVTRRTILLVEADDLLRTVLTKELKKNGWLTTVAADHDDALKKLGAERYDRLYINCYPPKWAGIELLDERRTTINADTPTFVVAGPAESELARAKELGATWVREFSDFQEKEKFAAAVGA